tara:strand:- start:19 stop:315 length:297 start_codon:yes stop_codon:yes gene_type:complete
MPTKREREYYAMGYRDGFKSYSKMGTPFELEEEVTRERFGYEPVNNRTGSKLGLYKPKRKLSAWNKFVKANSKKREFRYRNGKLNLKKMGVAFRRKRR